MNSSVYERINPVSHTSLLTTSAAEANVAGERFGFTVNMGTAFKASRASAPGLAAVVRLYNTRTHGLFWTASAHEASRAVSHYGYKVTGTAFYAATRPASCNEPVYRYRVGGQHFYTASASVRLALAKSGWQYEGIAFYAAPALVSPPSGPTSGPTSPSSTPRPSQTPSTPRSSAATQPSSSAPRSSSSPSSSSGGSGSTTAPAPGSGGDDPLARPIYLMTSGSQAWAAYQSATDPTIKRELYQIAATPASYWLGGSSSDGARVNQIESAAVAQGKTPVFVLYAIPHRDCGGYSAGGLSSVDQYDAWVDSVRQGIAGRPAVVIAEPDAIGWGCLSASAQAERIAMLKYALRTLSADPDTWVYIHAGSAGLSPQGVANALKQVGIQYARGFAINVSSFDSTPSEIAYGRSIDAALGMQKHFVIDTSRNGLGRYTGHDGVSPSCNPPGRAIGTRPTTNTGDPLVDAFLWIKVPGGSDGSCRPGDPPAGTWFQSYALGLVQRAVSSGIIEEWALPSK